MRQIKSERIKKLERELTDLEQWLKLGLVPKKDITKHKEEIRTIREKIGEEKERLQFLKESGEVEEYVTPKRTQTRPGYTEMPTIPDIDVGDTKTAAAQETGFATETEAGAAETTISEEREEGEEPTTRTEIEEESYFSDRARWRRGGIVDPDANEW